jgi:hypothetical protein
MTTLVLDPAALRICTSALIPVESRNVTPARSIRNVPTASVSAISPAALRPSAVARSISPTTVRNATPSVKLMSTRMSAHPLYLGKPTTRAPFASAAAIFYESAGENVKSSVLEGLGRPGLEPGEQALRVAFGEQGFFDLAMAKPQPWATLTLPGTDTSSGLVTTSTKTDYKDLDTTPKAVASTTATLAANAAHLARLLKGGQYPTS